MPRFRDPAYTGENRCIPCTGINVVIAGALAALTLVGLSIIVPLLLAATTAVTVFTASVLLIWAWGYLVPGTPTLTRRYLPPRVLKLFGKEVPTRRSDPPSESELEAFLVDAGIVEECVDEDDLCLVDSVAAEIHAAVTDTEDMEEAERYLDALGVDMDAVVHRERSDAHTIFLDGRRLAAWPSATASLVDAAIGSVIPKYIDEWASLDPFDRARIIGGLRVFLPECPHDGGAVELRSETVSSCCSEHEVIEAVCAESGDRLFEQRIFS